VIGPGPHRLNLRIVVALTLLSWLAFAAIVRVIVRTLP
jgi:hypothetical protein